MLFFRASVFAIGYFIFTITYGCLSLLLRIMPLMFRHRVIVSWTTLIIVWLRLCCGVRYNIVGRQNLYSLDKPFVILAKHQSTWETLFLQSFLWPACTVLKKELLTIPFFGWGLSAMNPIGIDRSNPLRALKDVKQKGLQRLEQGFNLILFPEGTRMKPGERGKYARSGADIALKADTHIVPIAINAGICWPGNDFIKHPGTISVVIGEPISSKNKTSKTIILEVEEWIETQMDKLPTE